MRSPRPASRNGSLLLKGETEGEGPTSKADGREETADVKERGRDFSQSHSERINTSLDAGDSESGEDGRRGRRRGR